MDSNNFVEELLLKGFKRRITELEAKKGRYDGVFNTKNGWMGLTTYHPFELFEKGYKKVTLSLERYRTCDYIFKNGVSTKVEISEKEIRCFIGDNVIYENKNGVLPTKEVKEIIYND